jgi:hypothetical protein
MTRRDRRNVTGILAVAVGVALPAFLSLSLAGCSADGHASRPATDASTAPHIEGPWAAEFSAEWEAATTDFERQVLEDGVVSDQEYSEMTELFRACLSDEGIDFDGFAPDGSYETTSAPGADQDATHDAVKECSRASGEDSVGLLYSWVHRNPERLDDNTIVVECLHESGVVDRSYTAAQYEQDVTLESYPFVVDLQTGLDAVEVCESDPLGLLGLRP